MIFLLSPAKSLDYTPLASAPAPTQPLFVPQSQSLIEVLRSYTPQGIASLMDLSDNLAALNVGRYEAWSELASPTNALQAVLAFNGDVYEGLDARNLSADDLHWLQSHLCILSGLYGVLRPLDLMQFWKHQIAPYLNSRLASEDKPVIVNLASQEYFKAVDTKALKARVVECVFQENKGGQYKIVSFMAKRARGLMVRHAAIHRLRYPEELSSFNAEGYAFDATESTAERLVFRR